MMKKIVRSLPKKFESLGRILCCLLLFVLTVFWFDTDGASAHRPHDDTYHVELSPNYGEDQTLFITVRGNLLKSTDAGETWERVWKGLNNRANLFSISISSKDPQTIFVSSLGNGIYKSRDRGISWTQVNQGLDNLSIDLLASSPQAPNLVFAAGEEKGLYQTKDGGQQWYSVLEDAGKVTVVGFSSAATNPVVAGDNRGTIYLSQDEGETWQKQFELPGGGAITAAAFSPNFAADNTFWVGTENEGIFKTEDGGISFSQVNRGLSDRSVRDLAIVASDGSPNFTLWAATWDEGIFYSEDGGNQWQKSSRGLTKSQQADEPQFDKPHFNDLEFSDTFDRDRTLFLAGFNGIFTSRDGGQVWRELDALSSRLIVGLAVSPDYQEDGTIAVADYVGKAHISPDGGATWRPMKKGLEVPRFTRSFQEPIDDPRRYFDIAFSSDYRSDNTVFLGFLRDFLGRSGDGGESWEIVRLQGVPGKFVRGTIIAVSPNFAGDRTLYLATNQGTIYRSTDAGGSFSVLHNLDSRLTAFVISPNFASDRTLYASGSEGVFKSVDGGESWREMTGGADSTQRRWLELAISPNYQVDRTLISGTNRGLFKTADGGQSWTPIAGLPGGENGYIEAVALSPDYESDRTFLTTVRGRGTFKTVDDGDTFTPIDEAVYLARIDNVPSASVPIKFSPSYAVDRTIYGFGSPGGKVFKSVDGGETWETAIVPTYESGDYDPFTFLSLALYVHGDNLLKLLAAAAVALLTYVMAGKTGLEKRLPVNKVQLQMGSAFVVFLLAVLSIKKFL